MSADTSLHVPSGPPGPDTSRRWLAMPFIAMGVAMIIVDATIVNVAVPTIIRELHLTATEAEWLNSIYSLVFAALLITLGHVGDRWGRRRLFLLGVVVFIGASLVAATATSGSVLIFGRFLQGIGGAMILPATLSTVNALFVGKERAVAFAIWGSTIGGFAALGPLIGGWLTTDASWRWAFLVNVPIGVLIVVGIALFIPETSDPSVRRGIDVPGNLLVVVGFSALVFSLIEGVHYGWWTQTETFSVAGATWPSGWISPIPLICIVGVLSLIGFVVVESSRKRRDKVVLVDLDLFRIRSFGVGNIAALVVALGEFGLLFILPLFLQGVLGFTALRTGVLLLSLAVGTFAAGGATPQLANRIGARGVARLGLAFEAVGIFGLGIVVSATVGAGDLVPWLFVYGVGVGMATAQLTGVILTDVPVPQSGEGSGIQSTSRQVGSALGIAILGTIFVTEIGSRTRSAVAAIPGVTPESAARAAATVRASGGAALHSLGAQPHGGAVVRAAADSVVTATRDVSFVAGAFILLGLLATVALPPIPPEGNPSPSGPVGPEAAPAEA